MKNLTSWKYKQIGFLSDTLGWCKLSPSGFQIMRFALFWYAPGEFWCGIEIHWKGEIVLDWTLYDWSPEFECEFCGSTTGCGCEW